MGCDIHAFFEIKLNDDKWHLFATPRISRNYSLFNAMAGVRGEGRQLFACKGLPLNLSDVVITYSDYDGADAHTKSWLSIDEIIELSIWMRKQPYTFPHNDMNFSWGVYFYGNDFSIFKDEPKRYPWCKDIRLVFWFDN